MIDFNLRYTEKETGKEFVGRRIVDGFYSLIDLESGLKFSVTYYRLRKNFLFDKDNKNNCCERNKKLWSKVKLSGRKIA